MIKVLNDVVALKPLVFEHDSGTKQQIVKGFSGTDKLSKSLVLAEVALDSNKFKKGAKVYLKSEVYQMPQAKAIMKIQETEFILLPDFTVVAVEE